MTGHPCWPEGFLVLVNDFGLFHNSSNGVGHPYHFGAVDSVGRQVVLVDPGYEYGFEDLVCWIPTSAVDRLSWEFTMDIHSADEAGQALRLLGLAVPARLAAEVVR